MVEMQSVVRFYSPWSKPGILLGIFIGAMLSMAFDDKLRQLLVILGAGFFPLALDIQFHLARLLKVVRKTATTPIGQAQAGYVELAGRAEGVDGQLLQSPKSNTPCVWHRIEWSAGKIKCTEASHSPFLLRDTTGHCLIDVDEATVFGRRPSRFASLDSLGIDEWVIRPGDPVYAMGKLAKISAAEAPKVRNQGDIRRAEEELKDMRGRDAASPVEHAFTLTWADQMARYRNQDEASEANWKARQAAALAEKPRPPDMLAHWQRNAAAFLKQFDVNRDGRVDLQEMVGARARAAEFEQAFIARANAAPVTGAPASRETAADTGSKIWILRRPVDPALPFLILNREPEDAERYLALRLWTARAAVLAALAVPVVLLWMKYSP